MPQNGENNDHHGVKQKGGRKPIGNIHIGGFDHRGNGGNGRAAANAGASVDQTAGFPVEAHGPADQRAKAKAGGQRKHHYGKRKTPHGEHGANIQAGTQQNNGEFQNLFRGEFNAGRREGRGLFYGVYKHADKHGDHRCANKVQPGAFFQHFKAFGNGCDHNSQRHTGQKFRKILHHVPFLPKFAVPVYFTTLT